MPRYQYPCLTVAQRDLPEAPRFCCFFAPAGEVLAWSAIQRLPARRGGIQRVESPAKVRGVKRFFERDPRNTISSAVVVALRLPDGGLQATECAGGRILHVLNLDVPEGVGDETKPGLVIDGQHRLLGAREFSPALPLAVVALISPTQLETAFQFLIINNKASKITTDHIRALALEYSEEGLEQRLRTARLSLHRNYEYVGPVDTEEGSPFRELIDWPANRTGQGIVVPAAIEGALQYILEQDLQPLKDDDPLLEFFYAIWNVVREHWGDLWQRGFRLLSKVGVICLTRYLTDALAKRYEWGELELADPEAVRASTEQLLEQQSPRFWSVPWKAGGYDTGVGRQTIVEDLARITRNLRAGLAWHDGLKVVDLTQMIG